MVVRANGHQAGELALRARVGLQRHGGEPGDFRERLLELADDLRVALHLLERREGMDRRELRPRHRNHLGRRIQLHRAGAERNHRAVEADVLALEALQVAHHLRFRPMRRENRMRHERRLAHERIRHCARRFGVRDAGGRLPCRLCEHGRYRQHVAQASSFRRARCRCASCRSTGNSIRARSAIAFTATVVSPMPSGTWMRSVSKYASFCCL